MKEKQQCIFDNEIYKDDTEPRPQIERTEVQHHRKLMVRETVDCLRQHKISAEKHRVGNEWVIDEGAQQMTVQKGRDCPCTATAGAIVARRLVKDAGCGSF